MSAPARRSLALSPLAALAAIWLCCSAHAKTTGVDEDAALQTGPCYQALVDRNVSQPTTAPNRELGAACAAEHDDVERAWARVMRLWGSDSAEVPDYDSYVRADAGAPSQNPAWLILGIAGVALVYPVCGTPLRAAARLFSGAASPIGSALATLAGLSFRGVLALALLWLLAFPYCAAIGALAFVILLARDLGSSNPSPDARPAEMEMNGAAAFVAETINDLWGAAPGLLGLMLFARYDSRMVALALALALAASAPSVIVVRRRLRAHPMAKTILAALLAAEIGVGALFDAPLGWLAQAGALPRLAAALALALAVAGWGWRHAKVAPALASSDGSRK